MKDFFKQLVSKLFSSIVFFILMFFLFACVITGEFPPKINSVRAQYQNLVEMKKNSLTLMKAASERLKASEGIDDGHQIPASAVLSENQGQVTYPNEIRKSRLIKENDSTQDIAEIRREQLRLKSQIELISQQNNEILKLLIKNQK